MSEKIMFASLRHRARVYGQRLRAQWQQRKTLQEIQPMLETRSYFQAAVLAMRNGVPAVALSIAQSLVKEDPRASPYGMVDGVRILGLLEREELTSTIQFWVKHLPAKRREEAVQFLTALQDARACVADNRLVEAGFVYHRLGIDHRINAILDQLATEERYAEQAHLLALLGRETEALQIADSIALRHPETVLPVYIHLQQETNLAQHFLFLGHLPEAADLFYAAAVRTRKRDLFLEAARWLNTEGSSDSIYRAANILLKVGEIKGALDSIDHLTRPGDRIVPGEVIGIYLQAASFLARSSNSLDCTARVAHFMETIRRYEEALPLRRKIAAQTGNPDAQFRAYLTDLRRELHPSSDSGKSASR